jgi:hypothetical protein
MERNEMKHLTIESWASILGYIVERQNGTYVWFRENDSIHKSCFSIDQLMNDILEEIKESYVGEK